MKIYSLSPRACSIAVKDWIKRKCHYRFITGKEWATLILHANSVDYIYFTALFYLGLGLLQISSSTILLQLILDYYHYDLIVKIQYFLYYYVVHYIAVASDS